MSLMRREEKYKLVGCLALVGVGLAIYLLYEFLAPAHQSPCYLNSTINCEATTKGVLSMTFGIPTALYGLTGYVVIFIAAVKKWKWVLLGMTAFGLLFCLRISFLEIFVLKVVCPVCVACQLVMVAVFALALAVNFKK